MKPANKTGANSKITELVKKNFGGAMSKALLKSRCRESV
jgi:hypothetical protein